MFKDEFRVIMTIANVGTNHLVTFLSLFDKGQPFTANIHYLGKVI